MMTAKNRMCLFALLLISALSFPAVAANQNDDALWRPRLATPALVAPDTPSNRESTAEV